MYFFENFIDLLVGTLESIFVQERQQESPFQLVDTRMQFYSTKRKDKESDSMGLSFMVCILLIFGNISLIIGVIILVTENRRIENMNMYFPRVLA